MSIFKREKYKEKERIEEAVASYFETLSVYSPRFTTFEGGIYEMELTRAAVHCFANHCSKLKPQVTGAGNQMLERTLQFKPNPLMDTKKYLYRLATITQVKNNAYILPLYDDMRQRIVGFYPAHPDKCSLVKYDGVLWLTYELETGYKGAVEFSKVGRITQFQNRDELFGESNAALKPTLQLLDSQKQAIVEAVRNSSNIQFLARLGQTLRKDDLEDERERIANLNLRKNKSGFMVFDAKYADVRQIDFKQYTVDEKQGAQIRESVYDYFGVSENLLQNKFTSEEWNAYYEGKLEPFALELSLVHTDMAFTNHELAFGNEIIFASNRMNYLSTGEKVNLVQMLFDRGMLTQNEGREIINMPADVPDGDQFYIRKEYAEAYNLQNSEEE